MSEFSLESLTQEISKLKEELDIERKKRLALEDECDTLAIQNKCLNDLLSRSSSSTSPQNTIQNVVDEDLYDTLQEGDLCFANEILLQIPNASNGLNVTCTAFCSSDTNTSFCVVGGTDSYVRGYDLHLKTQMFAFHFSAPIIALDCNNNLIACAMMDGTHAVVNITFIFYCYNIRSF